MVCETGPEWTYTCFIMPKENGTLRLITDLRDLNKGVQRDP